MLRDKLQAKLKKLPDLERMLSRIYTYSQRTSVKAIYIDISVITRLDEFYTLLAMLGKLKDTITEIFTKDALKLLRSKRLKALVQFRPLKQKVQRRKKRAISDEEDEEWTKDDEEAIFPDIRPLIEEFEKMIQWKSVGSKKVPEPVAGLDAEFDRASLKVEAVKKRLDSYLEKVRKQLKCLQISYTCNSKRFRYELEMPEDMHKRVP